MGAIGSVPPGCPRRISRRRRTCSRRRLRRRRDRLRGGLLARLRSGSAPRRDASRTRHPALGARAARSVHGPRRPWQEVQNGTWDARPHRGHREGRGCRGDRVPSGLPPRPRARAGDRRRRRPARRPARAARVEGPARAVRRRGDGARPRARHDRRRARDRVAGRLRAAGARLRAHARDERRRVHRRRGVRVGTRGGGRRDRGGCAVPHPFQRHRLREPQREESSPLRRGNVARGTASRRARTLRTAGDRDQRVARRGVDSGDRRGAARRELRAPRFVRATSSSRPRER